MNIDYEAIHNEAHINSDHTIDYGYVKAIIEAYERQKARPEWVPLDLATVKQGQEVRMARWTRSTVSFVCAYSDKIVVAKEGGLDWFSKDDGWLMRAQKPKTVRVQVLMERIRKELRVQLASESPPVGYWQVVGEGDIEVRE